MRKALLVVAVLAVALTGAASASGASIGHTDKIERLQPVHHSAVHGFVLLRQLQHGGSFVAVLGFGLQPNTEYGSFFYYTDGDCDENPEEVGTFVSNSFGIGFVSAVIDEDVDEVGSVSVRTPDYSVLFACADFSD